MADDLKSPASASAESQAIMPPLVAGTLGSGPRPAEPQPAHRFRFGFAYIGLAAVLGVAVGTFVLLMDRPPDKAVPWSSWQPTSTAGFRIDEITRHVTSKYRQVNGRQLLVAIPSAPSITEGGNSLPISGVARHAPIVRSEGDLDFTPLNNGLMYLLCGATPPRCSLSGTPSQERGQLVRREALELALYTFKYVDGVESILTFMPPASGTQSSTALFFRRADLAAQLARPVTHTLPARPRMRPGELSRIEGTIVDTLTLPHLFRTQPTQGQDGSLFLVLEPAALSS